MNSQTKYIIKILPADGCNPEFSPDKESQAGCECNGFALIAFDKNGDVCEENFQNVSIAGLARWLEDDESETAQLMRQASAIAEGYLRAFEINNRQDSKKKFEEVRDILETIIPEAIDDE